MKQIIQSLLFGRVQYPENNTIKSGASLTCTGGTSEQIHQALVSMQAEIKQKKFIKNKTQ